MSARGEEEPSEKKGLNSISQDLGSPELSHSFAMITGAAAAPIPAPVIQNPLFTNPHQKIDVEWMQKVGHSICLTMAVDSQFPPHILILHLSPGVPQVLQSKS